MFTSTSHGGAAKCDEILANVWTDWKSDLEGHREYSEAAKIGVRFVVVWYLKWARGRGEALGVESAREFWRDAVRSRDREEWQLDQWAEGLRWYLDWQASATASGCIVDVGIPGRVRKAVMEVGARRGLALRTRKTYAGWCVRFASECSSVRAVLDESRASTWLGALVSGQKLSFATQKQALNALVFFYRDVCERESVDLQVRFRRGFQRVPVVLSAEEVRRLLEDLEGGYRVAGALMCEAGDATHPAALVRHTPA